MRTVRKLFRAAAIAAVALTALSLSATAAEAKSRKHDHRHRHHHGHRHHAHACAVRPAAMPRVYAPRPTVVLRPVLRPYPVASVVYHPHREGVDGFIAIAGPHVSIGIGF